MYSGNTQMHGSVLYYNIINVLIIFSYSNHISCSISSNLSNLLFEATFDFFSEKKPPKITFYLLELVFKSHFVIIFFKVTPIK